MAGTRAAIRYAKAILDMANSKGAADDVNNDMTVISDTIRENNELSTFLQSPTIASDIKDNVLLEVFDAANQVTKSLFRLLSENKRFEILGNVASEYNTLFEQMNGVETARVTTAIPMDAELESKVHSKIMTFTNKKVVIENIVDPSIIGGFILRIGDQQYNASVANRLKVLKRELSN